MCDWLKTRREFWCIYASFPTLTKNAMKEMTNYYWVLVSNANRHRVTFCLHVILYLSPVNV
jgi:hypothetical protein